MELTERQRSITRDLITLAAAVVVIAGMKLLATVVVPILTGMLLFVAFYPLLRWFERKGISAIWARISVIATALLGILLVLALVIISVAQIARDLPENRAALQVRFDALAARLSDAGVDVSGQELGAQFDLEMLVNLAVTYLPGVISAIGGAVIALFIFIYAVFDTDGINRRLRLGIGNDDTQLSRIGLTMLTVSDYIRIRAILGGLAALLDLILLLVLGVEYALLWALVAFAMSFVPYIGYWIALVPPLLLALIESGWTEALVVFLGYWIINGAIDNLLGPRMLGHGLNVAPAVTIISILFWGFVLGPVGAVLAMPLTVGFKLLLLDRSPNSRWLALLISARDGTTLQAPPEPVPEPVGARPG